MKICILGGTGFIGKHLENHLISNGHRVFCYGRSVFSNTEKLANAINETDLLINLSGANIGKRWSTQYKIELWNSRIETSKSLLIAMQACEQKPKRIICASAIGIYPQSDCQHPVDENTPIKPDNFLAELGQAWEAENRKLDSELIVFRFGVVLGKTGGALQKMLPAFQMGLGGPVAGGQQCFSWIHIKDLIRGFEFALQHPELKGTYNLTSPTPISNEVFGRSLAKTLKRPFWLPLPEWQLKLMFGEGAQVLTHSAAVLPTELQNLGFEFNYPTIDKALENILVT